MLKNVKKSPATAKKKGSKESATTETKDRKAAAAQPAGEKKVGGAKDVDLHALVVDKEGAVIDAVYNRRQQALDGSLVRSVLTTAAITVDISALPPEVVLVIVLAIACGDVQLDDIDGSLLLSQQATMYESGGHTIGRAPLHGLQGQICVVACIKRSLEGTWSLSPWTLPGKEGSHFMDILGDVRGVIRKSVAGASKSQKVALPMSVGSIMEMPRTSVSKPLRVTIGWDLVSTGFAVDLDVSAVLFLESGEDQGGVWWDNTSIPGLAHTGDTVFGETGNDEEICVNLAAIQPGVHQIVFVASIYSKAVSYDLLKTAYCRVTEENGVELANFRLTATNERSRALIMARLIRDGEQRWNFQACGTFCRGRFWMDPLCMEDLKEVVATSGEEYLADPIEIDLREKRARSFANLKTMRTPTWRRKTNSLKTGTAIDLTGRLTTVRRASFSQALSLIVHVGVSWDLVRTARHIGVDLDISVVCFSKDGKMLGSVYFDNTCEFGIRHSGDNLTGGKENGGDDEVIDVDLKAIPFGVEHIFFLVNVYTKDLTFDVVQNAYCHVYDEMGNELANYALASNRAKKKTGLVIARMHRLRNSTPGFELANASLGFGFEAVGAFCGGRSWMEPACMEQMKRLIFQSEMKKGLTNGGNSDCPSEPSVPTSPRSVTSTSRPTSPIPSAPGSPAPGSPREKTIADDDPLWELVNARYVNGSRIVSL